MPVTRLTSAGGRARHIRMATTTPATSIAMQIGQMTKNRTATPTSVTDLWSFVPKTLSVAHRVRVLLLEVRIETGERPRMAFGGASNVRLSPHHLVLFE